MFLVERRWLLSTIQNVCVRKKRFGKPKNRCWGGGTHLGLGGPVRSGTLGKTASVAVLYSKIKLEQLHWGRAQGIVEVALVGVLASGSVRKRGESGPCKSGWREC